MWTFHIQFAGHTANIMYFLLQFLYMVMDGCNGNILCGVI